MFVIYNLKTGEIESITSDFPLANPSVGVKYYNFESVDVSTWDKNLLDFIEKKQTTRISRLAFRNRFTQSEKVKIELSAVDDPSLSFESRQIKATIRSYLNDVNASLFIDLSRKDTIEGVKALELMNLISPGRANEILFTEVQPDEEYKE